MTTKQKIDRELSLMRLCCGERRRFNHPHQNISPPNTIANINENLNKTYYKLKDIIEEEVNR